MMEQKQQKRLPLIILLAVLGMLAEELLHSLLEIFQQALKTVVLRRSTPQTQTMDLIDNDPMSADTIETAHDKAIAISQELQEQVNRSIKFSRTKYFYFF
jgi:Asp-tRNA(Asn)/Glu-tRNA(Gln) amidotransferase B subunit